MDIAVLHLLDVHLFFEHFRALQGFRFNISSPIQIMLNNNATYMKIRNQIQGLLRIK